MSRPINDPQAAVSSPTLVPAHCTKHGEKKRKRKDDNANYPSAKRIEVLVDEWTTEEESGARAVWGADEAAW
jgi:hypothetical protein